MSKRKSLTEKEIKKMESNSYNILIANDMYIKNGTYTFTASQAEKYYSTLLDNISHTLKNGTSKQRDIAMKCLTNLKILPFRVQ